MTNTDRFEIDYTLGTETEATDTTAKRVAAERAAAAVRAREAQVAAERARQLAARAEVPADFEIDLAALVDATEAPAIVPAPVAPAAPAAAPAAPIGRTLHGVPAPLAAAIQKRRARLAAAGQTGDQAAHVPVNPAESIAQVAAVDAGLAAAIAPAVEEGAHAAATAHLVRGGVLPSQVNAVAGYNGGAGVNASHATASSQSTFRQGATSGAQVALAAAGLLELDGNTAVQAPAPTVAAQLAAAGRVAGRGEITAGNLIAGAAAEGEAILTGWKGRGEMPLGQLRDAVTAAGLPLAWLPAPKKASTFALRACHSVRTKDRTVRSDERSARWIIGVLDATAKVGSKIGDTILEVTLTGGELKTEGDAQIGAAVVTEFRRLCDAESLTSNDVTDWLRLTLREQLGATRIAGNWYVPKAHAAQAEQLCTAVAGAGWGYEWMIPGIPVATSEAIRVGIARGLGEDADEILRDLADKRAEVVAAGKATEISNRAAIGFVRRLRDISERTISYGVLLGEQHVAPIRAKVLAELVVLDQLVDDTSLRGAMIWDEIAFEAERGI